MSQHQPLLQLPRHQQRQRLQSLHLQLSKRPLLPLLQPHLQRQLLQLQPLLRLLCKHLLRHQPQRPLRRQWRPSQRLRQPQHRRQPQPSQPQHPLQRQPQPQPQHLRPPRPRVVSSRVVVRPKRLAHRRVWLHVRCLRKPIVQRPRCRQACLLLVRPVRPVRPVPPVQRLRHGPHRQLVAQFLHLRAAPGRCRLLAGQSHLLQGAPVPAPVHLQVVLVAIRSRLVPAVPVAPAALVLAASRHAQAVLVVPAALVLVVSRHVPVVLVVPVVPVLVAASPHAQVPAAVLVVLVVPVAVAPAVTTAHAQAANVVPRVRARAVVVVVTSTSCSRSSPVTTPPAMHQFQMAPSSSSVACRLRSSLPS